MEGKVKFIQPTYSKKNGIEIKQEEILEEEECGFIEIELSSPFTIFTKLYGRLG